MKNFFLTGFLLSTLATSVFAADNIAHSTNNYTCNGEGWEVYLAIDMSMQASNPWIIVSNEGENMRFDEIDITQEGEEALIKAHKGGMHGAQDFTISLPYIDETTTFFTAQFTHKTTSFVVGGTMENDPNMKPETIIQMQCQAD